MLAEDAKLKDLGSRDNFGSRKVGKSMIILIVVLHGWKTTML
jgi:hypothetical protein